jgi:hypothetical protein
MKLTRSSIKLTVIATVTCALFSAQAYSAVQYKDQAQPCCLCKVDASHWYLSGNLGVSHLHDNRTPGTTNSVNENGPGWNIDAGYQFNPYIGAEMGFTQYHFSRETTATTNVATTEHYSVDAAAVGRYPFPNKFGVLAKLGIGYGYANKIYTASGLASSAGSVSVYGGLGVTYSVTPKVDFVAQWAGLRGNHLTGSNELYSLGVIVAIV